MAGQFSKSEWTQITDMLEGDPSSFGMPEGGREESLVFASFNIRKLGTVENRKKRTNRRNELQFLARFCARCDLVAIQEVQDSLEGLHYLKEQMELRVAGSDEFGLVVSDINGAVPGEQGMAERLAFIYRKRRVRRLDMASDLNIDRSTVMEHFFDNQEIIIKKHEEYLAKVIKNEAEGKKKPTYAVPAFVTFIRSPHVVAFEIPAANGVAPVTFAAVNAHLIYGTQKERNAEFEALAKWITHRLTSEDYLSVDNFMLLGDLNFDFDKPTKDRKRIEARFKRFNEEVFGDPNQRRIYFPLVEPDPKTNKVIRTNARLNQTYDQIAFFLGSNEKNLPNDTWRTQAGSADPDGFTFGVFNFVDLFARALTDEAYLSLSKAEKKILLKKFEHSVSDHMPVWVRIPRPGF